MKKVLNIFDKTLKILVIILVLGVFTRVSFGNGNEKITNESQNKTLDLTAMAYKLNEIQLQDIYYPLDTFTGDLTGYSADCPLCTGYLSCNNQYVVNKSNTYYDSTYGNVYILASSTNLPCGSIIKFDAPYVQEGTSYGIVLDRGVLGTDIDLLVPSESYAVNYIGRHKFTYDVLRFGWTRE